MRVQTGAGSIALGETEVTPTVGIFDFSRRVTDDFGTTTVVERGFSRRMSVRLGVASDQVDALQRTLADLRATSATWIADDQLAWLAVDGFYKDFEIELTTGTLSYCKLTVEGLAETEVVADPGGDPALDGMASTLRLLQPATVTDAVLVSSSVAENDYAAWATGTTYAAGARVIKAHRIYESIAAGNQGNDPATAADKWLDIGPTKRWAMFDQALGTATTAAAPLIVTLSATAANAVALLDVVGSTVRVQAAGYDQTKTPTGGTVTFLDLLTTTGNVTVTVAGSGTVSVGTLLIGKVVSLGVTETSPTAGIRDFSRKVVDDFGDVTVVERAWAKRMTARALIRTDAVDVVANRIAAVRATPSLWIGGEGIDALTIYGFFRDFSIEVGDGTSRLSLSVEGLSKAPAVAAPVSGGDGISSAQVAIYQRAATAPALPTADATYTFATGVLTGLDNGWAPTPPASNGLPLWVAYATAAGSGETDTIAAAQWGAPKLFLTDGLNSATVYLYQRSASAPALPSVPSTYTFASGSLTGHNNGWSRTIPGGSDPLYVTQATASSSTATDTVAPADWSAAQIMAQSGASGLNNATVTLYQRASSTPAVPSVSTSYTFASGILSGINNGWSQTPPAANGSPLYATQATASNSGSTDTIAANEWAAPFVLVQDGSGSGSNGINSASIYLYQRAASAPLLPSAPATYTFATAALSGINNGWLRTIPAGTAPIWVTTATAAATTATDTIAASEWAVAEILAQNGADGANGLSVAEVTVYQRATSQPATPTGGSYNFGTKVLTAPSGWSPTIPSGTNPLYAATGTAAIQGTSGIATPTWVGVGKLAENGSNGSDGAAVDVIFTRSATQPSTPAASAGVPGGWYTDIASVPASANPLWSSFGQKAPGSSTFAWDVPTRVDAQAGASNVIVNSGYDFPGDFTYGWKHPRYTNLSKPTYAGVNLAGFFGALNVGWAYTSGGFNTGEVFEGLNMGDETGLAVNRARIWGLPVLPGDRIFASCLLARIRCSAGLGIVYWDADGGFVTETFITGGALNGGQNGDPANFARVGGFTTVPSGNSAAGKPARFVTLHARAFGDGQSDPHIFYTQFQLLKVPDSQAVWPDYVAGPRAGRSALGLSAVPPTQNVNTTNDGVPKAAIGGFAITAILGTANVSASATYAFTSFGLTGVAHAGGGVFTVTGMTAESGWVEVTVTAGGASQKIRVPYQKVKDGSNFNRVTNSNLTGTSQLGPMLAGPNGNVTLSFDYTAFVSGSGSANATGTLFYSLDGGNWTAVSGGAASSGVFPSGEQLNMSKSVTLSGASIGLSAKQNLWGKVEITKTGSGTLSSPSGVFTVEWS